MNFNSVLSVMRQQWSRHVILVNTGIHTAGLKTIRWYYYAAIVLVACMVYIPTLRFGFTGLDDVDLIVDQQYILNNITHIPALFTHKVFSVAQSAYYRPLLMVSFMFDSVLGKGNPLPYHVTNVLLHAMCCLLLFHFLMRFHSSRVACIGSCFFAIHPMHVHAVAWIMGRNDILLGIFCLCAAMSFIKYLETKKIGQLIIHSIFIACALLTKENAIMLLPVLIMYYACMTKRHAYQEMIRAVMSWAFIVSMWFSVKGIVTGCVFEPRQRDILPVFFDMVQAFIMYTGKIIFPVERAVLPIVRDTSCIPFILVLCVVSVCFYRCGINDKKKALFGCAWFFFFIILSIVFPMRTLMCDMQEHRLYVPMMGMILALSEIRLASVIRSVRRNTIVIVVLSVFIICSFKTMMRLHVYRDEQSFAAASVKESPHFYIPYKLRGDQWYKMRAYDKAFSDYSESIMFNPVYADAYNNRGVVLYKMGKFSDATNDYTRALIIAPLYAAAYQNRAIAYMKLGDYTRALNDSNQALEMRPKNAHYYNTRGNIVYSKKQYRDALDDYSRAIAYAPTYAIAYKNRAVVLYALGHYERALQDCERALQLGYAVDEKFIAAIQKKITA